MTRCNVGSGGLAWGRIFLVHTPKLKIGAKLDPRVGGEGPARRQARALRARQNYLIGYKQLRRGGNVGSGGLDPC